MRIPFQLMVICFPMFLFGQTTLDYFSRPGLNINSYHQCYVDCGYSTSYTFYEKKVVNGDTVLFFSHNDGAASLGLQVLDKKVYRYHSAQFRTLLYDFGLEEGAVIEEGFYEGSKVVSRSDTTLLNGESRMKLDLVMNDTIPVTWVEGIGDLNRGLATYYELMATDYFFCARDSMGDLLVNPGYEDECAYYSCVAATANFTLEKDGHTVSFDNHSRYGKY